MYFFPLIIMYVYIYIYIYIYIYEYIFHTKFFSLIIPTIRPNKVCKFVLIFNHYALNM
jgi:hypothetical protein